MWSRARVYLVCLCTCVCVCVRGRTRVHCCLLGVQHVEVERFTGNGRQCICVLPGLACEAAAKPRLPVPLQAQKRRAAVYNKAPQVQFLCYPWQQGRHGVESNSHTFWRLCCHRPFSRTSTSGLATVAGCITPAEHRRCHIVHHQVHPVCRGSSASSFCEVPLGSLRQCHAMAAGRTRKVGNRHIPMQVSVGSVGSAVGDVRDPKSSVVQPLLFHVHVRG